MMAPYLAAADVATEAAADDDRKPALLNDDGTTFVHGETEEENSSSGSGDHFFLPSESGVGLTRGRRATAVGSGGKMVRRKKLQHFLGQIKQLMVSQKSGTNLEKTREQRRMRLGTLDALNQALQVLRRHSVPETRRPTEANSSGFSSSPASPDSPSSSADSSSACLAVTSEEPVPKDQIASNQLPMNEDGDELLKPQSCPSSSSATCQAAPPAAPPMLGRRFLGTLFVSLPEGAVLECRDAGAHQPAEGGVAGQLMSAIIRPGDSLLALLHGKGAQTMLLNAFCGHPRRRMYARLKWGNDTTVRACELLCEFSVDPQCVARRLASIQLFCVQSGAALLMTSLPAIQQPQQQQKPAALTFTTRHNSGCALIYLDSASIPLLGHFPSEVTGKSLFTLVHPEDARRLRDAHQQLHSTGGQQQQQQIVRTPGLRLLAHSGQPVPVDSEWAAFVNPWTRHIEMVVGRHTFQAAGANQMQTVEASMATAAAQQLREEQAAFVHSLLAEPVPQLELPLGKVEYSPSFQQKQQEQMPLTKEEPREEEQQQQQQQRKSATISSIFPVQQQQQQQVQLSYTQINCLENVHRLLKSQSQSRADTDEEAASRQSKDSIMMPKCEPSSFLQPSNEANNSSPNSMAPNSISQNAHLLTRELLQLHDQRWEEECRDSWRRRLSATGGGHGLKRCAATVDRPLLVEQHSPPPAKQFRRSSDGCWLLMDNHNNNNSSSHGFEQPPLLNFQPQQQLQPQSPSSPIFPTNPSAALMLDNGGGAGPAVDLQLLRCLLAQQHKQQQQQASIASPQLLLDHLLQAANVARNTLAIQLMQQQ